MHVDHGLFGPREAHVLAHRAELQETRVHNGESGISRYVLDILKRLIW